MRRLLPLTLLLGVLALAIPAAAQPLDLTMTLDLYCGDPAVSGALHLGTNVATVGYPCYGSIPTTGGLADAYGINLTSPSQITITVIGTPIEVLLLGAPYSADDCIADSHLVTDPTLTICLPAGYYPILLTTAGGLGAPYQISVTCTPCEPVAEQTHAWGGLKSMFR